MAHAESPEPLFYFILGSPITLKGSWCAEFLQIIQNPQIFFVLPKM